MEWNPFKQSSTVLNIPLGILLASLKGLGVWWVSLLDTACESTVLLSDQSALAVTTILEHHVVVVPVGTFLIIPSLQSLSKPSSTYCCQW